MPNRASAVSLSLATSIKASSSFLSLIFFAKISRTRLRVCSGCRRSWLAAARKRDLLRLARSACHLALFNVVSARLRSVTSSIAITISQVASDSPRIFSAFSSNTRLPSAGNSISIS